MTTGGGVVLEGRLETIITAAVKASVTRTPARLSTECSWQWRANERQAWKNMKPGPKIGEALIRRAMEHLPKGRSVQPPVSSAAVFAAG